MKYSKIGVFIIFLSMILAPFLGQNFKILQKQASIPTRPSWAHIIDYARENLPQEGQLRLKSDGFIYLKVDDEYIHTLLPMLGLAKEGFKEPPYFRSNDAPGAHISIFYATENVSPKEVGQTFHFQLKKIQIFQSSQKTSYAVLEIESPELEKLREKYGLKSKLHGHEFHISIGKKTIHRK